MARICGVCCGLLLFSAMIVCGMLAGNPPPQTILRALLGLFVGYLLGSFSGWLGMFVVQENMPAPDGGDDQATDQDDRSEPVPEQPPEITGPQS